MKSYSRLRPEHVPQGDPCSACGKPAAVHRVKHAPRGNPCPCGVPNDRHRVRTEGERKRGASRPKPYFCGIDGEGQGRNPHVYFLLAAAAADGRKWFIERAEGLGTAECLDFMLNLPNAARLFAYSFNYDLTKILKDIPAEHLYLLARPDKRRGKRGPRAIVWGKYKLNLVATKFTIEDTETRKRRVVWDVWKFFRGKFVSALKDWKIEAALDAIEQMKEKRSNFDRESKDTVREYCFSECVALAKLVEKLTDACSRANIPLTSYYGAGSIASAILDNMNIKKLRGRYPPEMMEAIACAFYGGRFEHIVVGKIEEELRGYDISSAYPYQTCFLPCLLHGNWERTTSWRRVENARAACIRYSLRAKNAPEVWGPFPFRTEDGSIIFPASSGGGWVWREEFLAGARLFKNVEFEEAWVFESDCDCPPPFAATAQFYLQRLALGKDAAGTVIKLGMNSEYGKLAQSSGSAPYQDWGWAGMVTSGTRGQLLDFLGLHERPENMLLAATDGVYTREKIVCPEPRDTGTESAVKYGKLPLGSWDPADGKLVSKGLFAARPGIYFPLNPTDEEVEAFRARGISRSVLVREHKRIVEAWENGEPEMIVPSVTRFVGMKSGTLRNRKGECRRTDSCGEWVEREIRLSFDPAPKRGPGMEILHVTGQSAPYKKSVVSQEAELLAELAQECDEQPDGGDLTDWA